VAGVDEADEMLSMGFIDDVKRFSKLHRLSARQLFSATMPPSIRHGDKVLRSPVTVTAELKRLLQKSIRWLFGTAPLTKALQRILNWKTGIGFNFVRTRRTAG